MGLDEIIKGVSADKEETTSKNWAHSYCRWWRGTSIGDSEGEASEVRGKPGKCSILKAEERKRSKEEGINHARCSWEVN